MINIRAADIKDIKDITDIYNQAILQSNSTFDIEPKTIKDRKNWFKKHNKKNPIIVAEKEKKIVGYASLSKWSDKKAYSDTVEISLYIKKEFHNQGIGTKLMSEIIKKGKQEKNHIIIALITQDNDISIKLHKKFGFKMVGLLKECGFKFNKKLNVYIMQKILN